MRALRTHYADEAEFVRRVDEEQRPQGYRIVGAFEGDACVAVAGFRVLHNLAWGDVALRGRPLHASRRHAAAATAAALLEWCAEEARRLGCARAAPRFGGRARSARTPTGSTSTSACGYSSYHFVRPLVASRPLSSAAATLRRTPLFERHERAGARLVPFAGWEMPVQYEGIRPEHVAVRTGAGMFDVSHMGEIETRGPQAEALLQRLLSNDVTAIAERGAQYSVLCRDDGGVLDDLFTYRLGPERFLTVTNAANHEKDLAWFREHAGDFDAEVVDAHADWAMIAVQGPEARAALEALGRRRRCRHGCARPS